MLITVVLHNKTWPASAGHRRLRVEWSHDAQDSHRDRGSCPGSRGRRLVGLALGGNGACGACAQYKATPGPAAWPPRGARGDAAIEEIRLPHHGGPLPPRLAHSHRRERSAGIWLLHGSGDPAAGRNPLQGDHKLRHALPGCQAGFNGCRRPGEGSGGRLLRRQGFDPCTRPQGHPRIHHLGCHQGLKPDPLPALGSPGCGIDLSPGAQGKRP